MKILIFIPLLLLLGLPVLAVEIPEADGSDGVFNPTTNIQVNTRWAAVTNWNASSPVSGQGVYDPEKHVVVYKYASVNIPAGVTVSFTENIRSAPVVWLVESNVIIDGTIQLSASGSRSGAGGYKTYALGVGRMKGGTGYGGGTRQSTLGRHNEESSNLSIGSAQAYGNASLVPLYGGSSGSNRSGTTSSGAGGGGGGAILIAAKGTITHNGAVLVQGTGTGGSNDKAPGSGGAVRLVAESIVGNGQLNARGVGSSGVGRIRVEAVTNMSQFVYNGPTPSISKAHESPVTVQPDNFPQCKVLSVDQRESPTYPLATLDAPDITVGSTNGVTVVIETRNAAPTTSSVELRISPAYQDVEFFPATHVSGDQGRSLWQVNFNFPLGVTRLQAQLTTE